MEGTGDAAGVEDPTPESMLRGESMGDCGSNGWRYWIGRSGEFAEILKLFFSTWVRVTKGASEAFGSFEGDSFSDALFSSIEVEEIAVRVTDGCSVGASGWSVSECSASLTGCSLTEWPSVDCSSIDRSPRDCSSAMDASDGNGDTDATSNFAASVRRHDACEHVEATDDGDVAATVWAADDPPERLKGTSVGTNGAGNGGVMERGVRPVSFVQDVESGEWSQNGVECAVCVE